MEDILSGKADEALLTRAGEAAFDERLAVLDLVIDRISAECKMALEADDEASKEIAGDTGKRLEAAFRFIEEAWGAGQELSFFMTHLTMGDATARFIATYGSPSYMRYSERLLTMDRRHRLRDEIINGE